MTAALLPHKLSELAQIALDDVRKIEARPNFDIVMSSWCTPLDERCAVCAAGSVMIETLGMGEREIRSSYSIVERFGSHNGAALLAIDALRRGCVDAAINILDAGDPVLAWDLADLDPECDEHPASLEIPHYGQDPDREVPADYDSKAAWRTGMEQLISRLKAAGL